MQLKYIKTVLAAGWAVGLTAIALFAHVTGIGSWISLMGLALLPPIVMVRMWNGPDQSLSQSIQEARR